uniref:Ovule protein n=1 Tax=Parastrongyloides trichosuri TaxID=131310 RepID=A0A0N4ZDM4_PARTI
MLMRTDSKHTKLNIKGYCPVQGAGLSNSLDESINMLLMLPHSTGSGKRQLAILNSIWYSGVSCSNGASESIGGAIFE